MQIQYIPLCRQQHVSHKICSSKQCKQDPFICPLKTCQSCKNSHQKCFQQSIQSLLTSFKNKGKGCKQFGLMIETVITQLEEMIKKLSQYINHYRNIKDKIGYNKRQQQFSKLLKQGRQREAKVQVIKQSFSHLKEDKYEIFPDMIDVIGNNLSDKFQDLMKFKMLNNRQISPQSLKNTFKVPKQFKQVQNQKKQLKKVLMQEGKIMTFWTFKLDNLKNITQETILEQIDYLKMISLNDWSFRKLQLIGRYLPNLKQLRIIGCRLDDSDAVMIASSNHLDSLQTLNLHHNKITGYGGLRIASAFKKVVNLFLGENLISQDAKKRIMEVMPKTSWVLPWTFNLSY